MHFTQKMFTAVNIFFTIMFWLQMQRYASKSLHSDDSRKKRYRCLYINFSLFCIKQFGKE